MPTDDPQEITQGYVDDGGVIESYGSSIGGCDRLVTTLSNGKISDSWLLYPPISITPLTLGHPLPKKLLIFHAGHFGNCSGLPYTTFCGGGLQTGLPILIVDMPANGRNDDTDYHTHDDVFALASSTNTPPMEPFFDPVIRAINYCAAVLDVSDGI